MTLIIATSSMMVADSGRFVGNYRITLPEPKIVRLPDGGLVGCSGDFSRIIVFLKWLRDGEKPEDADRSKDDDFRAIRLMPDGTLWRYTSGVEKYVTSAPALTGEGDACTFAEGVLAATHDPVLAMQIAIDRCVWVSAPMQVEHLAAA